MTRIANVIGHIVNFPFLYHLFREKNKIFLCIQQEWVGCSLELITFSVQNWWRHSAVQVSRKTTLFWVILERCTAFTFGTLLYILIRGVTWGGGGAGGAIAPPPFGRIEGAAGITTYLPLTFREPLTPLLIYSRVRNKHSPIFFTFFQGLRPYSRLHRVL